MKVHFLQHASARIQQRGLDPSHIADLVEAAAPMLKKNQALRFKVGNHVIVAQEKREGVVEVITAWEKPRAQFIAKPKKRRR